MHHSGLTTGSYMQFYMLLYIYIYIYIYEQFFYVSWSQTASVSCPEHFHGFCIGIRIVSYLVGGRLGIDDTHCVRVET